MVVVIVFFDLEVFDVFLFDCQVLRVHELDLYFLLVDVYVVLRVV